MKTINYFIIIIIIIIIININIIIIISHSAVFIINVDQFCGIHIWSDFVEFR
jgi:hypothetical protein